MNAHSITGPDAYRKRDIERTIIAPRANNNAHVAMQPLRASGPPAITDGNHAPVQRAVPVNNNRGNGNNYAISRPQNKAGVPARAS